MYKVESPITATGGPLKALGGFEAEITWPSQPDNITSEVIILEHVFANL